jgi:hypothetical protein
VAISDCVIMLSTNRCGCRCLSSPQPKAVDTKRINML